MEIVHSNQLEQEQEQIARTKDSDYQKRVIQRFTKGSVIRNARVAASNAKTASWAANAFSYLLAIYSVYYFAGLYDGWKFYFLMGLGFFVLAVWEFSKRLSAIAAFEGFWNPSERAKMWAGLALVALVAGSMSVTYYGGEKWVTEENNGPEVVHTARIDSLNQLIAKAEADNTLAAKQTWRGKITRDARKQMTAAQNRIDLLLAEKLRLENKDESTNDELTQEHETKMANLGFIFGGLGAVADLVLIFLLGFAEKKEWEVYCLSRAEAKPKAKAAPTKAKERTIAAPTPDVRTQVAGFFPDVPHAYARTGTHTPAPARTGTPARTYVRTPAPARTREAPKKKKAAPKKREGVKYADMECKGCKKTFTPKGPRNKYCTPQCRDKNYKPK